MGLLELGVVLDAGDIYRQIVLTGLEGVPGGLMVLVETEYLGSFGVKPSDFQHKT